MFFSINSSLIHITQLFIWPTEYSASFSVVILIAGKIIKIVIDADVMHFSLKLFCTTDCWKSTSSSFALDLLVSDTYSSYATTWQWGCWNTHMFTVSNVLQLLVAGEFCSLTLWMVLWIKKILDLINQIKNKILHYIVFLYYRMFYYYLFWFRITAWRLNSRTVVVVQFWANLLFSYN